MITPEEKKCFHCVKYLTLNQVLEELGCRLASLYKWNKGDNSAEEAEVVPSDEN